MIARPEATSGRLARPTLGYIVLSGAGAMGLGMFLPWVKMSAPIVGTYTKSLIEGGDGMVFLVLVAAIAVGAYFYLSSRFAVGTKILLGSAALLSAAFMIYELIDTQKLLTELGTSLKDNPFADTVSYGFDLGAYLASIGTVAVVVATVMIIKKGPMSVAAATPPNVPIPGMPVPAEGAP